MLQFDVVEETMNRSSKKFSGSQGLWPVEVDKSNQKIPEKGMAKQVLSYIEQEHQINGTKKISGKKTTGQYLQGFAMSNLAQDDIGSDTFAFVNSFTDRSDVANNDGKMLINKNIFVHKVNKNGILKEENGGKKDYNKDGIEERSNDLDHMLLESGCEKGEHSFPRICLKTSALANSSVINANIVKSLDKNDSLYPIARSGKKVYMNSLSKQSIGLLDEPGFIGAKQVQISSSSPRTSCALQEKCEGIENSKDVHLNRRKLSKLDKCKYLRRMKVKHELKHRIGMKSHLMINNFFSAIRGGIETAGMSSVSTFGSLQCSGLKINSISADGKKEMNENLDNSSEINANCFRKVLSRDKENLTNNNDCTSQAEQRNRNISARLPMNATFCRNCSDVCEVSTHGCSNFEGVQSKPCIFSVEKLHPEGANCKQSKHM
eukprot:Gb_22071 [translate_table: standard]